MKRNVRKERKNTQPILKKREEQRKQGKKARGRDRRNPRNRLPEDKAQYNFTDPESRIMKAGNGSHFEQSYNAQAAVDIEGSYLILGR